MVAGFVSPCLEAEASFTLFSSAPITVLYYLIIFVCPSQLLSYSHSRFVCAAEVLVLFFVFLGDCKCKSCLCED